METMRTKLQGVTNIVRFNWPFYLFAFLLLDLMIGYSFVLLPLPYQFETKLALIFVFLPIFISLIVSFYVYDSSNLYELGWLPKNDPGKVLVNINAGFDETSSTLYGRYKDSQLKIFDFYDPEKHTEASIERARNSYPPYEGTLRITTNSIPMENESADTIYLIFAAHEIRNDDERLIFFKELHRVLKPNGRIVVAEHLRDAPNFLAYTIGFFHFLPLSTWVNTFSNSGFKIAEHKKHTSFVNIFNLQKHGTTL
jgi:SAM-dependent methyltransferase